MAYTSLSALQRRFGAGMLVQLTDRGDVATGLVDTDVVDQALADTDAKIDASLGVRYRLPMATVPDAVADLALAIAIYKLHVVQPDKKISDDYEQALKDLRDFRDGNTRLNIAGLEPETSGAGGVVTTDRARDFTPENLAGLI